ncbi:MAG: D-sedoheptulose 7-phosphate isomerase [Desulfobulbaceae bacterium]|nr:D-sedoheptulose 7-phosphate isomerase [Desulfobulbaceae bacterium]
METQTLILDRLRRSVAAKEDFVHASLADVQRLVAMIRTTLDAGGKLLIFGNGGSAADAQHLAAEFVNRFLIKRRPLAALALTTDTSALTAIANDFAFEHIFSKQIEALGKKEDLALGISTSGNSANVLRGMEAARAIGMQRAALTGGLKRPGGDLAPLCDLVLNVPSDFTPHIQEAHLFIEHLLCELVERQMFPQS